MRTTSALTRGQEMALHASTIEQTAKSLTRPQADALVRVRDHGSKAWCKGLGRAGGAVSRMFERLRFAGLVTPAPHNITPFGREVLAHLKR